MKISKEDINEIVERYKKKTKKKCYKMELDDEEFEGENQILADKIGGKPYLPVGEQYPIDKNGNPMPLLLQINLKNINLRNFPKQGILEVFTNTEYPLEYQVKLFDEGLEYQTSFPETNVYSNGKKTSYFVKKPLFVKLKKVTEHMPLTNYKSDKIVKKIIKEYFSTKVSEEEINDFLKNDFMDFWLDELQGEIDKKIDYCLFNIGGYPNFSQADPRPRLKPRKNECVFSLDPIGLEEFIEIVDCGTMWGFISKEDLKNGKFENMFVDYDYC